MHRARDSRGRFIAKVKSSIFTTPSSPTHTPSLRIPGIQGAAAELGDSPTLSTKTDLGKEPFFTFTGEHIVIKEVESPEEERKGETLRRSPLIEEPEDFEETIMTEEVIDGFGGGGRCRGRRNNGGVRGNSGGNREGDNIWIPYSQ